MFPYFLFSGVLKNLSISDTKMTMSFGFMSKVPLPTYFYAIFTFIVRTAKEWNSLLKPVFPDSYNLGVFKTRVIRLLLPIELRSTN